MSKLSDYQIAGDLTAYRQDQERRELAAYERGVADERARLNERIAKYSLLLIDAAQSLDSYERSYGRGRGCDDALDIGRELGFDDNSDGLNEWLIQERLRLSEAIEKGPQA